MLHDVYVLITPAFNEAQHLCQTIQSVMEQTVRPRRWILVSDGSTDETDMIMKDWAEREESITYIRRKRESGVCGFDSKVAAIHEAHRCLSDTLFSYIGILDADITLSPTYYEQLLGRFKEDRLLGISGGYIFEPSRGLFESRCINTPRSVAGGIQFFRRECYEEIGGHRPVQYGGEDWLCEIIARMKGWKVIAYPDIAAYHHNPSAVKRWELKNAIREGKMDYVVGSHPLFEVMKCASRWKKQPVILYALFRLASYLESVIRRESKVASIDIVEYLRREQKQRMIDGCFRLCSISKGK